MEPEEGRSAHQVLQLPGEMAVAHELCLEAGVANEKVVVDVPEQIESILQVLPLIWHCAQVRVQSADPVVQVSADHGETIDGESLLLVRAIETRIDLRIVGVGGEVEDSLARPLVHNEAPDHLDLLRPSHEQLVFLHDLVLKQL